MNGNNRPPGGQHYNNQGFNSNRRDGPPGRGFGFDRGRGFHGGRGAPMGGRAPPPPPPRGGHGGRFGGPPRGRGFFPPERDNRFMGRGGGHPMGRGFDQGRGFDPGRGFDQGRGRGGIPPPPPRNMGGRGMPPPPPPRHYPGNGIPPPPMMQNNQRGQQVFGQGGFNNHGPPPQYQNQGPPPQQYNSQGPPPQHQPMHGLPPPPPQQHQQHSLPPMHMPPQAPYAQQQQHRYAAPQQQHVGPPQKSVHNAPPTHPQHVAQHHAPQLTPQQQPQVTQPAPSAYAQEKIDQAWTEHSAPNSMKYYYNGITKASTYTKPEALTRAAAGAQTSANVKTWVEYTDASTGKKYYSDGATTTWEKPDGFVETSATAATKDGDEPAKKKRKMGKAKITEFGSKSEAIAAFKGLLLAKDVQPTTKWNDVVKACSSDARWEACEILSQGERKQALAEYQTKRANELRDLERQERMRAKDAFNDLLTEVVPKLPIFNPMTSRFIDVREFLTKDDRFYAVAEESTRETLFLDFCEEIRKRDERKKRTRKREAKESFFAFLREREEGGQLSFASTWSSFLASLTQEDKSDPRYQASPAMSESDRELHFSDFVIELQAAEDEKRRRIRDARRRAEKAQRESYREMLTKKASEHVILPSTRWLNVEEIISNDPTYALVKEQDREAPRELFQDFVGEWDDLYRRDRTLLARLVQPSSTKGINVTSETKYEDFSKALLDEASPSPDEYRGVRQILNSKEPVSSAHLYFGELVALAKGTASGALLRTSRRRSVRDDSSEDEGEIVEDGEIEDGEGETNAVQNNDVEK